MKEHAHMFYTHKHADTYVHTSAYTYIVIEFGKTFRLVI